MQALVATVNQLLARVRRLEQQVDALENPGPPGFSYLAPGGSSYYVQPASGGYYLRP